MTAASSPETVLDVRGLTISFVESDGSLDVLDNLSFQVEENSFVCLIGPSGGGKSTLLRALHAFLRVPSERLIDVPQEIDAAESQRILQDVAALPREARGRVMTSVSRLGSRPGRLLESAQPSPGEVRKILLALGVDRGPHLILMDEPTNHMDLPSIACLEEALAECPCALLLVSHDVRFLGRLVEWHWRLEAVPNDPVAQLRIAPWDRAPDSLKSGS